MHVLPSNLTEMHTFNETFGEFTVSIAYYGIVKQTTDTACTDAAIQRSVSHYATHNQGRA